MSSIYYRAKNNLYKVDLLETKGSEEATLSFLVGGKTLYLGLIPTAAHYKPSLVIEKNGKTYMIDQKKITILQDGPSHYEMTGNIGGYGFFEEGVIKYKYTMTLHFSFNTPQLWFPIRYKNRKDAEVVLQNNAFSYKKDANGKQIYTLFYNYRPSNSSIFSKDEAIRLFEDVYPKAGIDGYSVIDSLNIYVNDNGDEGHGKPIAMKTLDAGKMVLTEGNINESKTLLKKLSWDENLKKLLFQYGDKNAEGTQLYGTFDKNTHTLYLTDN